MLIRVMVYDALSYDKQYKELDESNKKNKVYNLDNISSSEFFSGERPKFFLKPIVTLVVYYGNKPWTAPTSLYDFFSPDIDRELLIKANVPNIKMNLLSLYEVPDDKMEYFATNLRQEPFYNYSCF